MNPERTLAKLKILFWPEWQNNPYQRLLSTHLESLGLRVEHGKGGKFYPTAKDELPDVIHFHAAHRLCIGSSFLRSVRMALSSLIHVGRLRWRGTVLVWTVHDLKNHANRYLMVDWLFSYMFSRLVNAMIVHCNRGKQEVIRKWRLNSDRKIFIIPHANYISYYDNSIDSFSARRMLELSGDDFVMLFLGRISAYKGVPQLIEVFKKLSQERVKLIIAGKLTGDLAVSGDQLGESITEIIDDDKNIRFMPGFVPEEKVQVYMAASDLVILPFLDIFTSGSAVLAMSFGRACIAPRKGCIEEALDDSGAILYDPDQKDGLFRAMRQALQHRSEMQQMGEHNRQVAEKWDWRQVAEKTYEVYRWCLGS